MAHVAKVDENNIVTDIQVIANSDLPHDGKFLPEVELAANAFQHSLGLEGRWKLTSYNDNFRGRYAGVGYRYDEATDEFVPPGFEYIDGMWQGREPNQDYS